jgi:hypothetical protein
VDEGRRAQIAAFRMMLGLAGAGDAVSGGSWGEVVVTMQERAANQPLAWAGRGRARGKTANGLDNGARSTRASRLPYSLRGPAPVIRGLLSG